MGGNRTIAVFEWIAIGCLAVMTAVSLVSTVIRFLVPGMGGIYWAEEVTRYTSIWMVFIGAAIGIRYGIHLHVDLITSRLPAPVQKVLKLGAYVLMLAFEGVLVWYGAIVAWSNMGQQSSSLEIPMGWMYAAIPVGGVLMMLETVRLIVRTLRDEDVESTGSPQVQVD